MPENAEKRVKESLRLHPLVIRLAQAIADSSENASRSSVMELLMIEALKARSLIDASWMPGDGRGGDRRSAKAVRAKKKRKVKQQQNAN
jgi:hypothetical protein